MKKLSCARMKSGIGVLAALVAGLSPTSAAVIAQTFERPLAPNTLNLGPSALPNYAVGGKLRLLQWRIAPLAVDLENNGTTDLTFTGRVSSDQINSMRVSLTGRNEAWATITGDPANAVLALPRGSQAGPSLTSGNPLTGWLNDAMPSNPLT